RMNGVVDNNATVVDSNGKPLLGPDPNQGRHVSGRVPGKINVNTVWDPEVFLGVCDAPQFWDPANPPSNRFTAFHYQNDGVTPVAPAGSEAPYIHDHKWGDPNIAYDQNSVFGKLVTSRSPGLMNRAAPAILPT